MVDAYLEPAPLSTDPVKLQKIVKVLMDQVERGIDIQGNAYSLFQTAIVLEDKVRERTRRLETALRELEKSNHDLSTAKLQTETAQTRLMEAIESISEGFILFDRDDALVLCNTRFIEFWSGARDIREVVRPGISFRDTLTVDGGKRHRRRPRRRSGSLAARSPLPPQQSFGSHRRAVWPPAAGCRSASA